MRFNAILDVMRKVLQILAALLGLGGLAVVGNTIRLEILNRRAEIEVTKLVGGSNAFVRRPFLYTGLFYGLGGAAPAAAIVFGAVAYLGQTVGELSAQYGGGFRMTGLGSDGALILAGTGAVLGWLGA